MNLEKRIQVFAELGKILDQYFLKEDPSTFNNTIDEVIEKQYNHNPWFTKENVEFALKEWAGLLKSEILFSWIKPYKQTINQIKSPKKIGVIMAGNIPLVGMHDMLSVLICGHHFTGKLSSKDNLLPKLIADLLIEIEPSFKEQISIVKI